MKKKFFAFWGDFKKFIAKGNIVDMAVGVAVATAFTAIVTAFTNGFIKPLLTLISPQSKFEELGWTIREATVAADGTEVPAVIIGWGAFVQAIIDFLIIAFVMFVFLKIVITAMSKAEKMRKEVEDKITGAGEERAKAEAEAKAKAEAEAAAKQAEIDAENARKARELELLEQIAKSIGGGK